MKQGFPRDITEVLTEPPDSQIKSGVSRRDFLKFCAGVTVMLGLPAGMEVKIAEAATSPKRPPVLWLSAQDCTGCTESLLRTNHQTLENLILELISLDYHETLNTGSGHQAEAARIKSMRENKGRYILVVDGSVPVKDDGIYCKIGGKTSLALLEEMAPQAAVVVALGSCASWGGLPAADPNPTGALPVHEIFKMKGIKTPVVNIPGCPPNGYNFLSTILYFVTLKKLPELDDEGRPKFAYGRLIHNNCERRPHFDAARFAVEFGDEGHRKGYCLYKLGCKGPESHNNCPTLLYGDVGSGSWPVGTGHPCFGCSDKNVGFTVALRTPAKIKEMTPPAIFPGIVEEHGKGATIGAVAVAAGLAGAAIGAGAMAYKKLEELEKNENEKSGSKPKE